MQCLGAVEVLPAVGALFEYQISILNADYEVTLAWMSSSFSCADHNAILRPSTNSA